MVVYRFWTWILAGKYLLPGYGFFFFFFFLVGGGFILFFIFLIQWNTQILIVTLWWTLTNTYSHISHSSIMLYSISVTPVRSSGSLTGNHRFDFFYHILILPDLRLHVNEIIQWVWLLLLSAVFLRFSYVVAQVTFYCSVDFCCINTLQHVYPFSCWWTSRLFQLCATMDKMAVNIPVPVFLWTYVFISLG